jgi:biopolymer transport protein ExbD
MAMNVGSSGGSGEPEVMMDINTTPLIDVMLVLIIMLIITIPVQLHAVNLNMPTGTPPPPLAPPVVVTIDVDFDGTVLWNGEALPDRQALEARLQQAAAIPDQPEVHIRPNKLVEYRSVAAVLASAQRLGVTKLGMVGNEQFVK